MPRPNLFTDKELIAAIAQISGSDAARTRDIAEALSASVPTVVRRLTQLLAEGVIEKIGAAQTTRYKLSHPSSGPAMASPQPALATVDTGEVVEQTSEAAQPRSPAQLREALRQPLATRTPVSYVRGFVDAYIPNSSFLLPPSLADELAKLGRMQGQQPAGTYARKVLEQLLIDLSWSSSHLEGNKLTRLDTERLFEDGASTGDTDAVMLLNHKYAIEFLVDAVPEQGLTGSVIRNMHAVLMQDLLPDPDTLGAIRQRIVNISDTVYFPSQVPMVLEEMFAHVVDKARNIKNPIEAAFFLWVNIAYLQPFEDGNKRTSRLSANIPLMLYNSAPLSFMDVRREEYSEAMLGVYELRDVALAVELFDTTYRRSAQKYAVILESMGKPDQVRLRFRETLNDVIGSIVRERKTATESVVPLSLTEEDRFIFEKILKEELAKLGPYNCARYRLTTGATAKWIDDGRPS